MAFKKVTTIIQCERTEAVEQALEGIGVPGMSVTEVTGYGDYANFYRSPPLVTHHRIEIFVEADRVKAIVETILNSAHSGTEGDGVIAVLPVEHFYHIRDKQEIRSGSAD